MPIEKDKNLAKANTERRQKKGWFFQQGRRSQGKGKKAAVR